MSKTGQWIAGINAVSSALEHDIEPQGQLGPTAAHGNVAQTGQVGAGAQARDLKAIGQMAREHLVGQHPQ